MCGRFTQAMSWAEVHAFSRGLDLIVPAAPAEEGKVVQLVSQDDAKPPEHEPPKPPSGPRPALKRVK